MASCPFCEGQVEERLVQLGGPCPHCFAEIPGEEAPTDPGEQVRAQQEKVRKLQSRVLWVLPVGCASVLLCLLGIVAAWLLFRPQPVAGMLDMDDEQFGMRDMELVSYVAPEEAPEVAVPEKPPPRSPPPAGSGATGPLPATSEKPAETPGTPEEGTDVAASSPAATEGDTEFGTVSVGVARRAQTGVELTEDEAIIEMIRTVLSSEIPKLKTCYDQALKREETLQGRWLLEFRIQRDGAVKDVSIDGVDVENAEMESCIVERVAEWRFSPIRAEQPVQKSLNFRPI